MNVIAFSVTADQEVEQDFISISFSATETGTDANELQKALAIRVKEALTIAREKQDPGKVDVRSGAFQITPSYNKDGLVNGYEGHGIIIVSGTNTKTITELTGEISSMNVIDVQQGVSKAVRKAVEQDLVLTAIKNWREKSQIYAGAFDSSSYTLINLDIGFNNPSPIYARAYAMSTAGGNGQVPTESGTETITVSISGSIQLDC